jgi:hypothetical protein
VHVPKEQRKALDDLSEECILNGYESGNIYRLLTKKESSLLQEMSSLTKLNLESVT